MSIWIGDWPVLFDWRSVWLIKGLFWLAIGFTYQFRLVAVYSNHDNKHGPNSAKFALGSASLRARVPSAAPVIVEVQLISTTSMAIVWQVTDATILLKFIKQ